MRIKMTKMFMIAVAAIMFVACDSRAVGTNNNSNATENALETKASKKGMTLLRKLNYFNSINVNVPCDVYFTQGNASKARIVGTQEAISKLEFVVDRNGQLSISSKKSCNNFFSDCNTENLKIYLTSIDLIALNMMGAGDFKTLTPIDTDNLSVAMSGAGDIDFEKPVICDNFSVVLRGAGDIDFKSVETRKASVELYGTGDIDVNLHKVVSTDISVKGTGDVDVNFDRCGSASCSLYGTGDIELSGSLRSFSQKKYGTGNIDSEKLKIAR